MPARASISRLDLDMYLKLHFSGCHRLAITARYRAQHRLPHEARSLRNRLCDDDDDDASLHLRAYLPRLLSISSIFLLRNGGNEGNEDGEAGMEEGKERERMPWKRCRLFPFK